MWVSFPSWLKITVWKLIWSVKLSQFTFPSQDRHVKLQNKIHACVCRNHLKEHIIKSVWTVHSCCTFILIKGITTNVILIFSVLFTKTHLMCSYNDNQITLIYFTKPVIKYNMPEKLSRLEPKLQVLELAGPSGRRLERKLSCNVAGDMVSLMDVVSTRQIIPSCDF